MHLFHSLIRSDAMGMQTEVEILLPARLAAGKKVPVLYLLHGFSDNSTIWQRRTSIERYVTGKGLAVVMPNGYRSWYTDKLDGEKCFTYLTEELPQLVQSIFPISEKRSDTFIAGLSMGGYGAFKAALNKPQRYAAAASLSGAMDVVRLFLDPYFAPLLPNIFGTEKALRDIPHNLMKVVDNFSQKDVAACPKLFQCCGLSDALYDDNVRFHKLALKHNLPVSYSEGPGNHDWDYWDAQIQNVLEWLPIRKSNQ